MLHVLTCQGVFMLGIMSHREGKHRCALGENAMNMSVSIFWCERRKRGKETEGNMKLEIMPWERMSVCLRVRWISQRGRHHSAHCLAQQSCRQLASAPDSECKQLTQSDRPLCVCDSNTGWLHTRAPLQDCSPLNTFLTSRQTVPLSLSPTL